MDYQRKIFYTRRRKILTGKGLKNIIDEMIERSIANNCDTILAGGYPLKCIAEWARTNFGVDLKPSDIAGAEAAEIEQSIKEQAKALQPTKYRFLWGVSGGLLGPAKLGRRRFVQVGDERIQSQFKPRQSQTTGAGGD